METSFEQSRVEGTRIRNETLSKSGSVTNRILPLTILPQSILHPLQWQAQKMRTMSSVVINVSGHDERSKTKKTTNENVRSPRTMIASPSGQSKKTNGYVNW